MTHCFEAEQDSCCNWVSSNRQAEGRQIIRNVDEREMTIAVA